eukprot:GGOE01022464.1.p1 GENE.GGOE01022464.1~~GGOE01022464.1.p1  ORF type:complete len:298 (-),score=55.39 GGOE01022464.1:624-1517(-)
MGCASSIQAILRERGEPRNEGGREAKGRPPLEGADVANRARLELHDIANQHRAGVPAQLPGVPSIVPPKGKGKREDEALDVYVPPLSPRRVQEIERWLESLPAPSEVLRSDRIDLVANNSEQPRLGAGSGESVDEPPPTTVTLDQLQHTNATSSDGTGIPARRQSALDSPDECSSPLRMETGTQFMPSSSRASIARTPHSTNAMAASPPETPPPLQLQPPHQHPPALGAIGGVVGEDPSHDLFKLPGVSSASSAGVSTPTLLPHPPLIPRPIPPTDPSLDNVDGGVAQSPLPPVGGF